MVRSALGEMLPSEKKSSRRRRKTFGNEGPPAESETECRSAASGGTRSSISGFRLIAASSRKLQVQLMSGRPADPQHGLPRFERASGVLCRPDTTSGASVRKLALEMNASPKT